MLKKMIYLIYDSTLDHQVTHILKNFNIKNYTKIKNINGSGTSGLRLGNSLGPGLNNFIFLVVEDELTIRLKSQIIKYKNNLLEKNGLKMFIMPLEEEI